MNPKLTKILAGLVLFVSGAVTGFFGARLMADRGALALLHGTPEHFVDVTVHRLSRDLDLSQEQIDTLRPIVLETAKKLAAIREEQEPKIHEIIEKSIAQTKPLLTKDQLAKFEAILARLKARREAMERFGGPHQWGPPPPPPPGMDDMPPPPPPGMDDMPPPPPLGMDMPPPPPPGMEGMFGGPPGPPPNLAPQSRAKTAPATTPAPKDAPAPSATPEARSDGK